MLSTEWKTDTVSNKLLNIVVYLAASGCKKESHIRFKKYTTTPWTVHKCQRQYGKSMMAGDIDHPYCFLMQQFAELIYHELHTLSADW